MTSFNRNSVRIVSVVGLGYVGLPVAVAFAATRRTIGFDIQERRIQELKKGLDRNGEVSPDELKSPHLVLTADPEVLREANFHIVAVPTPVDDANFPDMSLVLRASQTVGKILKKGDIVVYESTVYPGATEEDCVPVLERASGLKAGVDFKVGYSPERINPGDTEHTFTKIKKVVSGQDSESLDIVADVYGSVVAAGVHRAPTIKVAEAAKVIENTQRDLNIALMNELAIIFGYLDIDTQDVLKAAGTKWNFLKFTPGFVGGHCIGVDPYYLTYRAEKAGYIPQVILSGRRINDGMAKHVVSHTIKEMIKAGLPMTGSTVTVMGLTFKENCPDIRNSKVADLIEELQSYSINVQVCDPLADAEEAHEEYGVTLTPFEKLKPASAVILAVAHRQYVDLSPEKIVSLCSGRPLVIDVKGISDRARLQALGASVWRL